MDEEIAKMNLLYLVDDFSTLFRNGTINSSKEGTYKNLQ
jgi:hypothetical protein